MFTRPSCKLNPTEELFYRGVILGYFTRPGTGILATHFDKQGNKVFTFTTNTKLKNFINFLEEFTSPTITSS